MIFKQIDSLIFFLAAHCINEKSDDHRRAPSDIIVYFGFYDLKQKNVTGSEVSDIILNPYWDSQSESYDGDIAILKLKDRVVITRYFLEAVEFSTKFLTVDSFQVFGF